MSSISQCCCIILLLLTNCNILLKTNGFSMQTPFPYYNTKSHPFMKIPISHTNIQASFRVQRLEITSFLQMNKAPPGGDHAIDQDSSKDHDDDEEDDDDADDTPIPFVDIQTNNFIECYTESVAAVNGIQYTIGVPCDHAVALCSFDKDDQLVPIDLDDVLMNEIYPVAESIVEDEFGDELVLQRTPQTLTLVGELDDGNDDDDDEEDGDNDEEDDDSEEVEILLSFEHKGTEYSLVRLLDPILLVGKEDPDNVSRRILLTPDEADVVMPALEEIFMKQEEDD